MGDVIHLDIPISDGIEIDSDAMLEANKGKFLQVVLAGYDKDGQIVVCSSHSSREALWTLERAKLSLLLETE